LRKEPVNTKDPKYQVLGQFSIHLLKSNNESAYRLLYQKDDYINNNKENSNKVIRCKVLKELAENNDDYFPLELRLDKLKKKVELTYEGNYQLI
jgi:hypothetical protein